MNNQQYLNRMDYCKLRFPEPAASARFPLIQSLFDFDDFKTICDVGCRFLEQSIEMNVIFPQAQIYSFEPVPLSYNSCMENHAGLTDEAQSRIQVFNTAITDYIGTIDFYEVDDTGSEHNVGASSKYEFVPGLNGSFFGKTWNQRKIQVPSTTLDQWRKDNNIGPIDVLWLDVQGAELEAFKGGVETLKDVKVILTEVGTDSYYQGQCLFPEVNEFLDSQGFKVLENSFVKNHAYEGDIIFIRK